LLDEKGAVQLQIFHKDQKTEKIHTIYLCKKLLAVMEAQRVMYPEDIYVFQSEAVAFGTRVDQRRKRQIFPPTPYTRQFIFRVIKEAADYAGAGVNVGAHTMRKTFAYAHYHRGVDIALLGEILQHATPEVTKRYICLNEDDQRDVYMQSDLGFPDELDELISRKDQSKHHLHDVAFMIHQICDLQYDNQITCLDHLQAVYSFLWKDPKHRLDYARRIIDAALYLEKRFRS